MQWNTIKEWFTNFGTVFSILGFFATIYFGIFYVPSYLREVQNEKIRNAEDEILQSVKELIFNDTTYALNELPTLIRAKEISLKEPFQLSLEDILSKTEESFMEDKFLPLSKRKELINKIEYIKQRLPKKTNLQSSQQAESKGVIWLSFLSIIATIISVILGIISAYIRFKANKEKDIELQNEIQDLNIEEDKRFFGYEFEKGIEDVLKKQVGIQVENYPNSEEGIDIIFTKDNKTYFVEAKYLSRSKIGLNTFHRLTYLLKDKIGEAWLVYNTDLTPMASKEIEEFNKKSDKIKIKPIKVSDLKDFEYKLRELL